MRNPRTLAELRKDPRVEYISDERRDNGGIWVYLKEGWYNAEQSGPADRLHQIHEDTVRECCDILKYVEQEP